MRLRQRLIVMTLTLAATMAAPAQTGDTRSADPASWVPENALVYLGVSDTTTLIEQVKKTAYYEMMQDPDAKDLSGPMSLPLKIYEEFKQQLAAALDTQSDRLRNPFGGPLALFVAPPDGDPEGDIQVVLAAGIGDVSLMRDYYDKATRKFREIADNHEKLSFKSHTIDYFTTETSSEQDENGADDDPNEFSFDEFGSGDAQLAEMMGELLGTLFSADSMPPKLALCLTGDRLIAAPTPDAVKAVLRRERSGPSLTDTESHKTLLREFKPLGAVRLLINLAGLFDLMEATEGDKARDALKILGARSARAVVGHVLYDGDKFESKIEALLLLRGERTGLPKIFSMENGPVTPPPSISADSFMYVGLNANLAAIVDEIERMVRLDDPEEADRMHATLESIEIGDGETLSLRRELLEKLSAPLTFALGFQEPYGPDSVRMLLTLAHRDKDALGRFLEKLSNMWVGMLIDREVRGDLIYDGAFGGMSLAVADDALLGGSTPAVESALRAPSPEHSLARSSGFKAAAALAPKEAWATFYVDSKKMYEAALEMARDKGALRAAQFTNPANLIALQIVESMTMGIEEGKLDAARRLSKYQAPSIFTVTTTPEGIRAVQIQLKAEAH